MALKIYDTLKPQGDYPAVEAADVRMPDGKKLSELEIPEAVTDCVKSVNGVVPDQEGNVTIPASGGVSSWNDLTDKPFYEESGEALIFAEQTLTIPLSSGVGELMISPAPFILVEGETYRVVWDGVEYELECISSDGILILQHIVWDESTGEVTSGTFQIIYATPEISEMEGGAVALMTVDDTENHTLAIYQDSTVIKTLDAKYLPMEAIDARIEEYISEALEGDY